MLERPAPAPEIYVTTLGDDDLFARAHTTLHVTDGDDGLRIFFRFTSQIFPVRNNYYFADTTIKAYILLKISFGSRHHNGHDLGTLRRYQWSGSGGGVTVGDGGSGYSAVPLL
ncbi:hypothetical protein QTP88_017926 [Uroleucon formosanum]